MTKLLEVNDLRKYFPIQKGIFQRTIGYVKAVDGISFDVQRGETLGLVGESGCGKTTAGRCLLRLIPPTSGSFIFGEEQVDLAKLSHQELRPFRRRIQMIFQDPHASLNPRMTVGDIVGEPMRVNRTETGSALQDRIVELLESVGLRPQDTRRYPHAFSGGQTPTHRHRARISTPTRTHCRRRTRLSTRCLGTSTNSESIGRPPRKVSTLLYLHRPRFKRCLNTLVIALQSCISEKIVEISDAETLYQSPKHPYTEALISAVPLPRPECTAQT